MSRTLEQFLAGFGVPLVAGGEMRVGKPVSQVELTHFSQQLAHATVPTVAIDEARTDVVSHLVVRPPAFVFDEDDLVLVCAVHNLLFLSHPRTESWTITRKAEQRVVASALAMAARPRTSNRKRVLARHGLLHNLFDVTRRDLRLTWWTGAASFVGQAPPKRLLRWGSIRRVRQESSTVDAEDLFGRPELEPAMVSLLRRSPLTHVLAGPRIGPPLLWEDVAFLLRDAELARSIAYHVVAGDWLVNDSDASTVLAKLARLTIAFEQMLKRAPVEADVRAVAAFLVYLSGLLAVGELDMANRNAPSPLLARLAPDRAAHRPRGVAAFFALPTALAAVDPRLSEPPGIDTDPHLGQRWNAHRQQADELIGEGLVDALVSALSRHLTAALPPAPTPATAPPAVA